MRLQKRTGWRVGGTLLSAGLFLAALALVLKVFFLTADGSLNSQLGVAIIGVICAGWALAFVLLQPKQ